MKNKFERFSFQQDKQSGKNVLFLHGFLENSSMWNDIQIDGICKLTVNLPGHGSNEFQSGLDQNIENWASQLIELLHEKGVEKYSIVGHSMGGYVALEMLNQNSAIEKVILLNSNFWTDSELKKENRRRVAELVLDKKLLFINEAIPNLFQHPEDHQDAIFQLISEASEMHSEAIGGASIAMANRKDFTAFSKSRPNKVVILQGRFDTIVPIELMQKRNGGELDMYFINSGHMSHIEAYEETINLLNKVLK